MRSLTVCKLRGTPAADEWEVDIVKQDVNLPDPGWVNVPITQAQQEDPTGFGVWSAAGFSAATAIDFSPNGAILVSISPDASGQAYLIVPPFHPGMRGLNGEVNGGGVIPFLYP